MLQLLKKIQMLNREKEDNLAMVVDLERDIKRLSEENMKQADENSRLSEDVAKCRSELDLYR